MAESQMDDLLGKLSEMMDSKISAALGAQQQAETPKATPTKATATASKAATMVRNLDPVDVDSPIDGLTFRVQAANGGGILTNGARSVGITTNAQGKERMERTITRAMLDALDDADVRKAIRAAMDAVDKRAHIGAHKPTVQVAS